jgi:hypothetical protein
MNTKRWGLTKRKNDTEDVEYNIRDGILSQCLNIRIVDSATPNPAKTLDSNCTSHDDERRDRQFNQIVIFAGQSLQRENRNLDERSNYHDGEDKYT